MGAGDGEKASSEIAEMLAAEDERVNSATFLHPERKTAHRGRLMVFVSAAVSQPRDFISTIVTRLECSVGGCAAAAMPDTASWTT